MPDGCAAAVCGSSFGAAVAPTLGRSPTIAWYPPNPMRASIIAMNAYVGTLKTTPDSRTPRRFTTVSSTIDQTQRRTVCGIRLGYADVIAATPDEIETATVRM